MPKTVDPGFQTALILRYSMRTRNNPCAVTRKAQVSDRALRYRANQESCIPQGPRICGFCGSKRNVEVHHIDGFEEHDEPENLMWACRSCNTKVGAVIAKAGLGRRTEQFNPKKSKGAKTVQQWAAAILTLKKGAAIMPVAEAVEIVRATPFRKRSEFQTEIINRRWELERAMRGDRDAVPF